MKNKNIQNYVTKILIVMILLGSTICFGQQQRRREIPDADRIEKMVERLSKELKLTEDQEVIIQALYTSHFNAMKEFRETNSDISREDMREKMKASKLELDTSILALLNEEQKIAYEEIQKKRKKRGDRSNRSGKRGKR